MASNYSVNQTSVFPNQRVIATETSGGITQMATSAQVAAGTRKDRAVSPYQLANATIPLSDVDITGGTIDGTAIGGTTRAAGAFTTLGANSTATLAALTQVGTASINATGTATTTIGNASAGVSLVGATGVTGALTASTTLTATSGAITATNGNFVASAAGTGLLLPVVEATGAASGPVVCNGRVGAAIFTSFSCAAAADVTLTITNSAIAGSSTSVLYSLVGTTTGSALSIKSVTNSAGSSAIVVTNGTGATTSTADVVLYFIVLN